MFYNHLVIKCQLNILEINQIPQICQLQILSGARRQNFSGCLEIIMLFLEISLVPWAVSFRISTNVKSISGKYPFYFQGVQNFSLREIQFVPWAESLFCCISCCVKGGRHCHLDHKFLITISLVTFWAMVLTDVVFLRNS